LARRTILWTLAVFCVTTSAWAQIRAELVVSGLNQPIAIAEDPTSPGTFFIAQKGGRIRTLVHGVLGDDYLDLTGQVTTGGEQGLLGFALAPDYASSGRVFVNFTNTDGHTVIARYARSGSDPLRLDPTTRFDLFYPYWGVSFIFQPHTNHNGGHLAFGPDGMLYVGLGDGGSGDDPDHYAQNPLEFLGKMLRIDVSVGDGDAEGYDVPGDNPYVGDPNVLPEIWAFGLRNPWRYSFDSASGSLLIADVGQNMREEISFGPAGVGGRNYGWRNKEGSADNETSLPPFSLPLIDPIHEYDRTVGRTITGGYVYRGTALGAQFNGRYFFADFLGPEGQQGPPQGRLWSFALSTAGEGMASDLVEHTLDLGDAATGFPVSFGTDSSGELYVLNFNGAVYKLVAGLVSNGAFDNGMANWFTFANPPSGIVAGVTGGVLEFYRVPAPPDPTNQAVVLQPTGETFGAGEPFAVTFDIGNSSSVRKRIALLAHDLDFSDLSVCTFWLPPFAPLRTYQMRTHTTEAWSNATVSFYAATEGFDGGYYQLDNVFLTANPGGDSDRTDCVDPTAPTVPGGAPGPDLVANGNFSTPLDPANDWGTFGEGVFEVTGGVFQFYRHGANPAAVVLQATGEALGSAEIITASFLLGNSSAVRKRVTVILHDLLFSDLAACTFWLAPGQPLSSYTMQAFATDGWSNATLSVYAATIGTEQWIQLDDVALRRTPGSAVLGTECIEPGGGSFLSVPSQRGPLSDEIVRRVNRSSSYGYDVKTTDPRRPQPAEKRDRQF
jgi:glucose/arabinose dehydrogenase